MKLVAILLCIAIGSVFGELEKREIGEEDLEVTEDEARFLIAFDDDKTPYSSDESLQVKYAQSNSFDQIPGNTRDSDSVEKKTSRNPLPDIETFRVKPGSSKAIKKNLEIMHFGKPVRKEANLARNSRKFLRRKRTAEVEDPTNPVESFKMYKKVREKLPAQLRIKTRKTDTAEENLLKSYATSNGDTSNLISDYKAAKSAERDQLKADASGSGATEVIDNYKALRKGKPWNYIKLRGKFKGFFGNPSASLTEYETLKQEEVASIDSFLGGSSKTEGEKINTIHTQEKEKPTEQKAEKSTEPWEVKSSDTKVINPNPEGFEKGPDDTAEKDEKISDDYIDKNLNRDPGNHVDSEWLYKKFLKHLSRDVKVPMEYTDNVEKALLQYSTDAGKFLNAYLDLYYECRRKEIEALKENLPKHAENLRPRFLLVYKTVRKGIPWNWIRHPYKYFFRGGVVPKPALEKYLAVKREELLTDQYLDGSLKAGEVPKEVAERLRAEQQEKIREEGIEQSLKSKDWQIDEKALRSSDWEVKSTDMKVIHHHTINKGKWEPGDDNAEKDAKMFVHDIEDIEDTDGKQDYDADVDSIKKINRIWAHLSKDIKIPMSDTDHAESDLLGYSRNAGKFLDGYLDLYYEWKRKEIEALKAHLATKSKELRDRILFVYKKYRTGKIWFQMKYEFLGFFEGSVPQQAVDKYLAVKKEELYVDQYLDGSRKVGEVPKKAENAKADAFERASSQTESEKSKRMVGAKVGERTRAEEKEKVEEMERRVRAKETETVEVEYDAYRENVENIVITFDDAKGDVEVHGNTDNVTSTDDTNRETTTDTKSKDNSRLLRFAIFFAIVTHVIIAILILAPQRDKLAEWCKRAKRTESGHAETEPLQAGEKVFATGPARKSSKSPLNTV